MVQAKVFSETLEELELAFPRLPTVAQRIDTAVRTNLFLRAELKLAKIVIPRDRSLIRKKKNGRRFITEAQKKNR